MRNSIRYTTALVLTGFGTVGAAGAQTDNYGISFAGATSYENTYIVEGINTTDTGFGAEITGVAMPTVRASSQ